MSRVNRSVLPAVVFVGLSTVVVTAHARMIWMIGDSTAASYREIRYPAAGWMQVMPDYLDSTKITIKNLAIPGTTTTTFKTQANWKLACDSMKKDDYMFVQFAHNDKAAGMDSATYVTELDSFARAARAKGAIPIFVTSINPTVLSKDTVLEPFIQPTSNFSGWMKTKAKALGIPVIDLQKATANNIDSIGIWYSQHYHYMFFASWEFADRGYWTSGSSNYNHLQEMGALNVANLFTRELKDNKDTVLNPIRSALTKCDSLVVRAKAGQYLYVNKSNCYPKGSAYHLKAYPDTTKHYVFAGWADSTGKVFDTARILLDTMQGKRVVVQALFKPDSVKKATASIHGKEISVSDPTSTVEAVSILGKKIELTRAGNGKWTLPSPGTYFLRIRNASGLSSQVVVSPR